ncbi:MAG: ADP-ribosylglycohydrolase family protein [Myxococcota bacterium]|jgi:ADP-ribosylglycohydrolase
MTEDLENGCVDRAQGCLLGQLAGDALGGQVEFQWSEQIWEKYPDGVRELADGGTWDTIAGQPTDDSEMALILARTIVEYGTYDANAARNAYLYWIDSGPFDCGGTISAALSGRPNPDSQANGAMMRASPLGIFGAGHDLSIVADWAGHDAALTHPNIICVQANSLYATAIAFAIRTGVTPDAVYRGVLSRAMDMKVEPGLMAAIVDAAESPPVEYVHKQGWILIAFQNALWQLLHAATLEEAVVNTVMRGGDTDTNAAICGSLLGAVYGRGAIPGQWVKSLLGCRPANGDPRVRHPRPECFWPVDALELAEQLLKRRRH